MSIKQLPNGEWAYRFNFQKRCYRRQGFRIRLDAEKAETLKKSEVIRRHKSGQDGNDDLRLADAADVFFDEYSQPHKRTWKMDRTHIAAIKAYFDCRRIRDISPRDVEAFRRWVHKTGRGLKQAQRTLHTVNHYHAALKAIINWAKKKRMYFGENPAWGVEMAKVEKARVRFLTPEEEKRLTPIVAKNSRLWPYYVLGLHTGMRLGEISAIRVRDIIRYPSPMIFIPNSKTRRSRYVPLSGLAAQIVADRLEGKQEETRLLDAVHKTTASEWFNESCKEAQVSDFTFHCLRHTFASFMLSKGVPIYKVSKMLGHSTVVTTEQHYGHLDRTELSKEIHHIDGVLSLPDVLSSDGKPGGETGEVVNKVVNGDGNAGIQSSFSFS